MIEFLRKKPGGNITDITRLPKQEAIYRAILKLNSGKEVNEQKSVIFETCIKYINNMVEKDINREKDGGKKF